ncbi:hypothetical protein BCR42DRAFT_438416 [Absidia repens]|uniref:BAG domain-containing protein n=1 Tax=Absidia repens TaxID=90262 RepID=A0A1X2IEZ7_9FUNG|nr:hypothetical protein BCR42DRAFT_438416 [Absidia repens]
MDSSSHFAMVQRWRREQEEQRHYLALRRRRYLQLERQYQRQRMAMAAMEQHERRRKRYQRAMEQRHQVGGGDQQNWRNQGRLQDTRLNGTHKSRHKNDARIPVMQHTLAAAVDRNDQDTHYLDTLVTNSTKLAALKTIGQQLDTLQAQNILDFFDDQKQHQRSRNVEDTLESTPHHIPIITKGMFIMHLVLSLYEDTLTRLLLQLDGVSSEGDDGIRQQRKALVQRTNGLLDQLDQYKR